MLNKPNCRFCSSESLYSFADLGLTPMANSYVKEVDKHKGETFYPLHAYVCGNCFLVQLDKYESAEEIFSDYAYFSSFSESWLSHAKKYSDKVIERFDLSLTSHVIEIASNDGYLLQFFKGRNMPILGIEPAANVAKVANEKGINTRVDFFGRQLAQELSDSGYGADLLVANNVIAHVPDLHDFVEGMKILLNPEGLLTVEFPHLMRLMENNQFDTIYHEHFSYFSFSTLREIFAAKELTIFDVEELTTHGGSLRVYVCHNDADKYGISEAVTKMLELEREHGLNKIETYHNFAEQVRETKRDILSFLVSLKESGKIIVGYGAPAKGNTLLNYCGISSDFLDYTVDRSPYKQGTLLPGTRIPVYHPDKIAETKPDYIFITPWNIKDEIIEQMQYVKEWGAKFVVPIPKIEVI
ncbi:SAM-dependent methyltransferase [Paenibacillus sambharensis]|uniref:SAM-dependent methyltransferase n=1 Tax=Paenibacillus sambharensis TaxID=1803190 RepID=A0A2W1M2L4_9BACL|nr:class I SAM-dependent methyltransferase [Paenibacillus sambharensis]PZD97847.1 SAM-dependent methyltransferase [Paenibacillus sambharensis]